MNIEKDIIGLTDFRSNLTEIVDEIIKEHSEKIIIRNGKPAVVVMNISDYQAIQNHLLALELEAEFQDALEEEKRGELIELDDLIKELGFSPDDFTPRPMPENYDEMIPKEFKSDR